jgi:hypothetical protein
MPADIGFAVKFQIIVISFIQFSSKIIWWAIFS